MQNMVKQQKLKKEMKEDSSNEDQSIADIIVNPDLRKKVRDAHKQYTSRESTISFK